MSNGLASNPNGPNLWARNFPIPVRDSNKYLRGHALICGGEMTGASRLAARAAQRIGAGVVTVAALAETYQIYATALEGIIVKRAEDLMTWKSLLADERKNAILLGPGLGIGKLQTDFILEALKTGRPCVLDADALTNFSKTPDILFAALHTKCILTPHEGEFAKLFGDKIQSDLVKSERAQKAADLAGCIVLLKGTDTYLASPNKDIILNSNGPATLATAGSGDVLAGLILGLIAQGMATLDAGAAAAWIHGEIAANFGLGLISADLIDGVPAVLKSLSNSIGIV